MSSLVSAALHSLTLTNPTLALDAPHKIIYRHPSSTTTPPTPRVALISGGGSGHEPSFSAFVGRGLLTASVSGSIFASPSIAQISHCLSSPALPIQRAKGLLVLVLNYTGDVLNFGVAVEKARAAGLGVEMVACGDDVSVGRRRGRKVGRRGVAGMVLLVKIVGAAAESGVDLEALVGLARRVVAGLVSVGASLSRCHVPGQNGEVGPGEEELSEGVIELGMGIHNEPGSARVKLALPELVTAMLAQLLDLNDADRAYVSIQPGDNVVLLVSNLGGVSPLELSAILSEVDGQLKENWKLRLVRIYCGAYMTSLNGFGFSISLLKIFDTGLGGKRSIIDLLDAPAEASGWASAGAVTGKQWEQVPPFETPKEVEVPLVGSSYTMDPSIARSALEGGLDNLINAEPKITAYDTAVGDGDCGTCLKRGAEAIPGLKELLSNLQSAPDLLCDPALAVANIAAVVERTMDGTSGALYSIFLHALHAALVSQSPPSSTPITLQTWSTALQSAFRTLKTYTPATSGDRTLIDALHPFLEALVRGENVSSAAKAAEAGASSTAGLRPSLGRAVYVGGEVWKTVPDPGAIGVAEFLVGMARGVLRR
ncbi:MAG: hypothetical protein M1829_004648 [Trizodia sp. TS-e1964]|nr:MAG: hypothetical protein M1829_004648 [Trizodia sp. TS-e1964]